jgi:hypothetical protein
MNSLDDGWSGPPGNLDGGNFKCPDCPESFRTPTARYNHRRKDHRVEQHRDRATENLPTQVPVEAPGRDPSQGLESDSPTDLAEIMDGLWIGSYYELTYRFARALHTKVPDMRTIKKRQIIQAFDENASSTTLLCDIQGPSLVRMAASMTWMKNSSWMDLLKAAKL